MTRELDDRPSRLVLSDSEVEEFRALARQHAGAELTPNEARTVVDQLLGVLSVVRVIALRSSTDSASSVDEHPLPEARIHAITTPSPT
jgi:hypothetical protein